MKRPLFAAFLLCLVFFCFSCTSKRKLISNVPNSEARRLYEEGKTLHEEKKYPEAQAVLTLALEENPNLGAAYTLLGRGALVEGKREEAKEYFTKALAINQSDAEAALGLGTVLTQLGDLGSAEKWLLEAKRLRPESHRVYFNLGELYAQSKEIELAEAAYREAIRFNPDYTWPRLGLARLLREKNPKENHEEAIQLVKDATQVTTDLDEPYHLLGLLYADNEKYDDAEKAFREALKRSESSRNLMNLGTILAWRGDTHFEEARKIFEKAIEIDSDYALAYNNLGHIFKQQNALEQALPLLEKAVALAPDVPLYQINLAEVLTLLNKTKEASDAYRRSYELLPDQASLARKFALSLVALNKISEAYQVLNSFIAQYPDETGASVLQEEKQRIAREELKRQLY